ncbi:MAG: dockerin type I domain-containing protein, partial [Planctomycetota bacterium]
DGDLLDVTGNLELTSAVIGLVSIDANGDPGAVGDFVFEAPFETVVAIADTISVGGTNNPDELTLNQAVTVDASLFEGAKNYFTVTTRPEAGRVAVVVSYEPVLIGDANQDGIVNLLDVDDFINAFSNVNEYIPEADANQDCVINLLDVQPFINALGGG